MKKHVFVISHRRSGTHLTIDAIRNNLRNFGEYQFLTFERLEKKHERTISIDDFERELCTGPHVIKTHYYPDISQQVSDPEIFAYWSELYEQSKKVYVFRNGLDVMVSLYEYFKTFDTRTQKQTFKEFLRSDCFIPSIRSVGCRVAYWSSHVESWLARVSGDGIYPIAFENWVRGYQETLTQLAHYIGEEVETVVDVRLNDAEQADMQIARTWVNPRSGRIGDYKDYFDAEDVAYFMDTAGQLMEKLGYSAE